ncbi:hypothetical protein ACQFX9_16520 [Aliinostoc sp. HNIBRCY26]|uniref:hypothetical protein n=1 Tax=Aliinostoc sp. HNIBRCY26 TaxID=3418997 RepID=UPI003D02659A
MNKMVLVIAAAIALSPFTLASAQNISLGNEQIKQTQGHQAEQSAQKAFTNLIKAIEENNYDQFISQGETAFKAGITKQLFTKVHSQFAPRIKKGYSAAFLGKLNQQGYQVYLWKLTFKDRSDDVLARLSIKDGKIGGFWLN